MEHPPAYQNGCAAHGGVHAHIRLVEGKEVSYLYVAVQALRLHQKGRFRPEAVGHSLHLGRCQPVGVQRDWAGISSALPGLEYNGVDGFIHNCHLPRYVISSIIHKTGCFDNSRSGCAGKFYFTMERYYLIIADGVLT